MSDRHTTTGTILQIGETKEFGEKGFCKREFILNIPDGKDGKWDQQIAFEVIKDSCDSLDAYSEGDEVSVDFNLRGREWEGRYFVNLSVWQIRRVGGVANAAVAATEAEEDISF